MSEAVAFKRVSVSEEMLVKLFSKERAKSFLKKGIYAYGLLGPEQEDLMGVCLFTVSGDMPVTACLEETYVLTRYRGSGYGKMLLDNTAKELERIGIKYILYRTASEDPGEVHDKYSFAVQNDFVPFVSEEKIFYYDIVNLLGKNFENKEKGMDEELKKVRDFASLTGVELVKFNESDDHGFYKLKLKTFDEKLTFFYMDKDEIRGVAKAVREGNKVRLNGVFLLPESDRIECYRALILKFVMAAVHDKSIETLVIQTIGKERSMTVKKICGKPFTEVTATELVRYL